MVIIIIFCFIALIILSLIKKWWSPVIAINFIIAVYIFTFRAAAYYSVRDGSGLVIGMIIAFPIIVLMAIFLAGAYSLIRHFLIKFAYRKYLPLLFILFPYLLFVLLSLLSGGIKNGFITFINFIVFVF